MLKIPSFANLMNSAGNALKRKKGETDETESIPIVLAFQFGMIGVAGVLLIFVLIILAIVEQNVNILKISIIGIFGIAISIVNLSKWKNGDIVSHYVTCLAVTKYSEFSKDFTVTFVDLNNEDQYVAKIKGNDCPYARGANYIIYTNKSFDGQIIAYEDTEFERQSEGS